jgi:hypothetical protein
MTQLTKKQGDTGPNLNCESCCLNPTALTKSTE